jgi:hypothetical protein
MFLHSKRNYALTGVLLLTVCELVPSFSMGQTASRKALRIQDGTIVHVVLTDSDNSRLT